MSTIIDDGPPPLNTEELRRLAQREKNAQDKRQQRARNATERAVAALAPNPSGYVVPAMPAGLRAIRKWVRRQHDAYSKREIGVLELEQCRRSASSVGDLHRVGADMRRAEAATRSAVAQERMAEVLAQVEHGGAAVVLLERLRNGLTDGPRRPLPGRSRSLMPPESASS